MSVLISLCCNTFSFVSKIELYNTAQLINLIALEAKHILTSQAWDVQAFLLFLWQTFYHSCAGQMEDPPAWQNKTNRSFFVSLWDFSPHCSISLQLSFAVSRFTVLHDSELIMSIECTVWHQHNCFCQVPAAVYQYFTTSQSISFSYTLTFLAGLSETFLCSGSSGWLADFFNAVNPQISNQITFIVTSPQHVCFGEWNSWECAPDSAETIYI